VVGADSYPDSGYLRAKVAQERLIKAGKLPYTVVRATQFFEFLGGIAGLGTAPVRLPTVPMEPLAADDVAATLAEVAVGPSMNATIELAGPETLPIAEFVGRFLTARGDKRTVFADPQASYFGAALDERGLTPGPGRASVRRGSRRVVRPHDAAGVNGGPVCEAAVSRS
jgi:uncharacterized protein YbjT (DUF2867 family)